MKTRFLSCEWNDLVVANFAIDPDVVAPFVPKGCKLDFHNGETFASLVAFDFSRTKAFGLIPVITDYKFEEINLRIYVKRIVGGEVRRGVTFIKEIVPSPLIAWTAWLTYNEP